jgi:glycosyltransferase involved in cell wall biosynthesis
MNVAWLCNYPLENLEKIPAKVRGKKGHSSTWIVNLSRALVKFCPDINLHIVTESTHISKTVCLDHDGIHFHVIRSASSVPFLLRGYPGFLPLDVLTRFELNKRRLLPVLDDIGPDLVHSHGTESTYSLTAVSSGYPHLVSLQGIISELFQVNRNLRYRVVRKLEEETIKRGHYFVAKTKFAAEFIRSINARSVVFRIENAMSEIFFSVKRRQTIGRTILYVGSIIKEKGIEDLLDSLSGVGECQLMVIGRGKPHYIRYLEQKAERLGIRQRITWLGARTSEEIAARLSDVSLLVLPSHMENSPNVVSEAMCVGVPVVATNVGGIPDLIQDGGNGILVPPNNSMALAKAIGHLLDNPAKAVTMGELGRLEAQKRFSPQRAANKTMQAYREIMKMSNE